MAKVVNNFVIDHVLRGIMTKKDGEYMWSINQITNPSLNVALSDTAQAVDALGTPIAEFDRGRSAEFSAENSLFDLGLYAAQLGQKTVYAETEIPAFEDFEYSATGYELKHLPVEAPAYVYALNGDGTLGQSYKVGTAADEDTFSIDDQTVSFPTNVKEGSFIVIYDYLDVASSVTADAINFPDRGRFVMEVLGCDVCDQTNLIHAYVEFPNAKLDGNVDYSFTTDGTHPFTIRAMQDYCNKEKVLFRVIIPEEA